MRLPVFLLLLQLWGNVDVSLSQIVCPTLPDVPHAHVSEETKKVEYQGGHVIHFTCDPGYTTSGPTITYVCSSEGWLAVGQGTCSLCPTLPDVPHAHVSEETKKAEYQGGHVVDFTCEPGYITSGPTIKYVCSSSGWLAVGQGTCSPAVTCTVPAIENGHVPGAIREYKLSDVLHYECDRGFKRTERPSTCIKLGIRAEWSPTPLCEPNAAIKCRLTIMQGTQYEPAYKNVFSPGETLKVICARTSWISDPLEDSAVTTCQENGEWSIRPTCQAVRCSNRRPEHVSSWDVRSWQQTFFLDDTTRYWCERGYQRTGGATQATCTRNGWMPNPLCEASTCDPPPADAGVTVKGLPENRDPILPGHLITFSCDGVGKYLKGNSELTCGVDGQWNNPFPSCEDKCTLTGVADSVRMTTGAPNNQLTKGQKMRFACANNRHTLLGNEEVECLENGRWSHPFPTCGTPSNCGNPPSLEDGDITTTLKHVYRHGERVEYSCQALYTMEGGPHKTCKNGEWTGSIKCMKPCTVDRDIMRSRNIGFKFSDVGKLYAPHNDVIDFQCTRGRQVGSVGMRQKCLDGVMNFPTCQ